MKLKKGNLYRIESKIKDLWSLNATRLLGLVRINEIIMVIDNVDNDLAVVMYKDKIGLLYFPNLEEV